MIELQIDMDKVNNTYLFKGKKGTYLNVILIDTPNSQFGHDYMIVQSVPKEVRDKDNTIKGNILGNAKNRIIQKYNTDTVSETNTITTLTKEEFTDEIPF